uniref:Polyprotein n=1 Tax=Mesocestoides corti TaxID=53468 RepID=A0A5K3G5T1_MESCO
RSRDAASTPCPTPSPIWPPSVIPLHHCRIPESSSVKDRYNRTGIIDQSEARATRQAPSIRVHHAGHAAHYILHLIHVLLWLAAFPSRMPLDRRETRDWLRPRGPTYLRPNPTP